MATVEINEAQAMNEAPLSVGAQVTIYYTWDCNEEQPRKGIINSIHGPMVNMTTVQYNSWFDTESWPIDVERHKFRVCDADWQRLIELVKGAPNGNS